MVAQGGGAGALPFSPCRSGPVRRVGAGIGRAPAERAAHLLVSLMTRESSSIELGSGGDPRGLLRFAETRLASSTTGRTGIAAAVIGARARRVPRGLGSARPAPKRLCGIADALKIRPARTNSGAKSSSANKNATIRNAASVSTTVRFGSVAKSRPQARPQRRRDHVGDRDTKRLAEHLGPSGFERDRCGGSGAISRISPPLGFTDDAGKLFN